MKIETICICGAGTMGSGIAELFAVHNFPVILFDSSISALQAAGKSIEKNLQELAEKGKISYDDRHRTRQGIHFTNDLGECKGAIVIEAIIENEQAKNDLFDQLSRLNGPETILATNTSSLSVSKLGGKIFNPRRFVGMHFFNPAPKMKLVEVVKGDHTADDVIQTIASLAQQLGKVPVICNDSPGFIVNRVARPYYLESLRLLEELSINVDTIDTLLEATGFRLGPFKLMDLIGNDINYAVSSSIYQQLGGPERLKPSMIQKQKLDKGELGRKSGKGYYKYN